MHSLALSQPGDGGRAEQAEKGHERWFVLTHQGCQAIMPLPGHLPASVTFWGLLTWGVAAKQEAEASPNLESKGGMLRPRRTEV